MPATTASPYAPLAGQVAWRAVRPWRFHERRRLGAPGFDVEGDRKFELAGAGV